MSRRVICLCLLLIASCYVSQTQADEHNHKYNYREDVIVWMSTVGPYHNQQYAYFSLPFCSGCNSPISHYNRTFIEVLQGVKPKVCGYEMEFRSDVPRTIVCMVLLREDSTEAFTSAVKNEYWYQMHIDGLSIWGKVGERDERDGKWYIFTHKKFDIGYNDQQIVDIMVTTDSREEIKEGVRINFSYEVNWKPSQVEFKDRFDPNFFQHRIYWFSIFKSCMVVILLVGLVSMILMRTLCKGYARYSKDKEVHDMERNLGDEYGWKEVNEKEEQPHKQKNTTSTMAAPALG